MKKTTLILVILLACFSIQAQNTNVKLGAKTGVNLSKYTPEKRIGNIIISEYQFKVGYYVGAYVNFFISDKIRIQPELLYSTQGTRIIIDNITLTDANGMNIATGDFESTINESTISIPVVLQYFLNEKFSLEGGPQFGYIINRKETLTGSLTHENPVIEKDYDKLDIGFNIGIGFDISKKLRVNSRYFLGLLERDDLAKPSIFSLGIEYHL
ncbi:porin family protein [uncultured Tenacibaculum sp.]|uniref:porin family protein n=1 Tax=uncultured Tenacibaculum sp. TaxID=174713 RepID=UPI00261BACE1|nr:porin family protein [uncultured Tenacibaculum sp.]